MSDTFRISTLVMFLLGIILAVAGMLTDWVAAGNLSKLFGFIATKGIEFLGLTLGGKLFAIGVALFLLSLLVIMIICLFSSPESDRYR